jgi:hypothetical protein
MEAADVGIDDGEKPSSSSDDELMSPKSAPLLPALAFEQITYVHIHQCDDFSVRAGFRRVWLAVSSLYVLTVVPVGFVSGRWACSASRRARRCRCTTTRRWWSSASSSTAPCGSGPTTGSPRRRPAPAKENVRPPPPSRARCAVCVRAMLRAPLSNVGYANGGSRWGQRRWSGQGRGRRRGAHRAARGGGAVPAERRQHARLHRRHAVRHPRRDHAALLGGAGSPVDLLRGHPRPVSPRCSFIINDSRISSPNFVDLSTNSAGINPAESTQLARIQHM